MGDIVTKLKSETVTPSPIPNATVERLFTADGKIEFFSIYPNDGYILHDKVRDTTDGDPFSGAVNTVLGYTDDRITCAASYEFSPVTVIDEDGNSHTVYGAREFFARVI